MNTKRFIALAGVCLLLAASANAAAISVNMNGSAFTDPGIALGTTAGVVPVINWNNITDLDTAITYWDNSKTDTTLGVGVVDGGMDTFNTGGTADERLGSDWVNGYTRLNLTNVPYAVYDLYIYNSTYGGTGAITFTNPGGPAQVMIFPGSGSPLNFTPTFQLDVNYVVFSGLTADATVLVTGDPRGLSAFQIVEITEPATMSLLAIGGIALLRRKRK
jgi:hypothetical protein